METHARPFDTHAFVKRLKAAGMPEEQAEILAETQAGLIEERLATKHDLKELEMNLKRDLKELEMDLKRDLKELQVQLEVKLAETKVETIKWVTGLLVVQAGVIIGAVFAIIRFLTPIP
ncbi:MAG: DUF1640 domain-containing protein [Nitrospirae bacterium]|nr:MAG: DUF1640 domain-containing protein [Nitrospirota bacterium]